MPKVLEVRAKGQSDLVDIAQVFQRSGTRSVSWAPGKGPIRPAQNSITDPADFEGKNVGVWDFGNEYEVTAAAPQGRPRPRGTDYTKVIQPFDMTLLLNREIDVAEAMIYNEYAQVLEATNPKTDALYQPDDLNVIDYNEVGTAMLQDAICRARRLAQAARQRGHRDQVPARLVPGLDVLPRQPGQVRPVHDRRGLDAAAPATRRG